MAAVGTYEISTHSEMAGDPCSCQSQAPPSCNKFCLARRSQFVVSSGARRCVLK